MRAVEACVFTCMRPWPGLSMDPFYQLLSARKPTSQKCIEAVSVRSVVWDFAVDVYCAGWPTRDTTPFGHGGGSEN